MRHWKPGVLVILPVGIAGFNGVLRVHVVPGGASLLLSKEFLADLGCHIDLGRGHLFLEKLGVRAVVTIEQSPHSLLPLTSFGPQGHKIPAEGQPRISSDECAIYRAACDSSRQEKYIRGSPLHLATEHLKPTVTALNPCVERMDKRKTPVMKRETNWENRKGTMGESTWHRQTDTFRPNARRTAFLSGPH